MNYPQNPTNLVQRAIAGENEAFDQLVKLHYSAVYRLALYLTNNDADAQDVTQQTFLSAFQNLRQLREEGKFSAWLKKITLNEYRTWRRQAFELVSYDDSLLAELRHIGSVRQAAPPDVECERRELYHQLLSAINSLSARNREAFKLYYLEEYSQKEVSEQLGISVSAVENRIMRAKKQLRQRLRRTIIMVDEKIAKVEEAGKDSSRLVELRDTYKEQVAKIKEDKDAAKSAWKESGDKEAWKKSWRDAHEEMKLSKKTLRDFMKEYKSLMGDEADESEEETTEEE